MNKERIDELMGVAAAVPRGEIPKYQHKECFTAGAFDLLLVNAHGPDAYELLTELCERIDALIRGSSEFVGYYDLLSQIARQSNTTEMPPGMQSIIDVNSILSHDLKTWYRCDL
jgi:hypothetical protein